MDGWMMRRLLLMGQSLFSSSLFRLELTPPQQKKRTLLELTDAVFAAADGSVLITLLLRTDCEKDLFLVPNWDEGTHASR